MKRRLTMQKKSKRTITQRERITGGKNMKRYIIEYKVYFLLLFTFVFSGCATARLIPKQNPSMSNIFLSDHFIISNGDLLEKLQNIALVGVSDTANEKICTIDNVNEIIFSKIQSEIDRKKGEYGTEIEITKLINESLKVDECKMDVTLQRQATYSETESWSENLGDKIKTTTEYRTYFCDLYPFFNAITINNLSASTLKTLKRKLPSKTGFALLMLPPIVTGGEINDGEGNFMGREAFICIICVLYEMQTGKEICRFYVEGRGTTKGWFGWWNPDGLGSNKLPLYKFNVWLNMEESLKNGCKLGGEKIANLLLYNIKHIKESKIEG